MKSKTSLLIYNLAIIIGFLMFTNSCKKDDTNSNPIIPALTTSSVSYFTQTMAICGGNINTDGGSTIKVRGVCWSSVHTPTISDSNTIDGVGIGSFTSIIKGLNSNTTYNIRAYATNSVGTGYGNNVTISTQTAQLPVLTTCTISDITTNSARSGGNITCDGGAAITQRGVCWSINATPTIADQKTTNGIGSGSYASTITGIIPNTKYYARAYATNLAGTSYGSTFLFTTLPVDGGIVTDIDGNSYHTKTIGTQIWMVENYKVTHYRNGDSIPNITDSVKWKGDYTYKGAQCDYNNSAFNSMVYGKLYNFYAVTDTRKLCPFGWHVPTDDEWTTLSNYLGGDTFAGGKLKETGTAHWISPNIGATNETGFTALPGGLRDFDGRFFEIGKVCSFWSSTSIYNFSWFRYLSNGDIWFGRINDVREDGFSVRCIKD